MLPSRRRLQEILLRDEIITADALAKALEHQKKAGGELSRILQDLKLISPDHLTVALSEALEMPLLNLAVFRIDPTLIKLIPKELAEQFSVIGVSKISDQMTVAMADPLDVYAIDNLKAVTGMNVTPILARSKDIRSAIERYYDADSTTTMAEILKDIKESGEVELVKQTPDALDRQSVENLSQEAPIITLTNAIIQQAVTAKASDVFIEPMEDCLRIRYRVDGLIREIDRMAKTLHFPIVSRIKVISTLDIAEHRLPQDGRFRITTGQGKEVDFRVSVLPTAMGEKIVLRILDKNQEMVDIDKLGFEAKALARLKEACQRPHGMILACGPTGSGKTTTLYAILKHIDSPGKNIVTVEDPVEFQMKGFNQVNIRSEFGLTFTTALRSILRQDPDVILIGEIRDADTLDIAVKAALTGHLVVSSLHTTTGPGSITRMINMGIEPFLITSSVIAIVAQRLVRRLCLKCREEFKLPDELRAQYELDRLLPEHSGMFYRPRGCDRCFKSGYQGRVGITEILVLTNTIKELILSGASELDIKNAARLSGMHTMREDAIFKAAQGLTSFEEVVRLTAAD